MLVHCHCCAPQGPAGVAAMQVGSRFPSRGLVKAEAGKGEDALRPRSGAKGEDALRQHSRAKGLMALVRANARMRRRRHARNPCPAHRTYGRGDPVRFAGLPSLLRVPPLVVLPLPLTAIGVVAAVSPAWAVTYTTPVISDRKTIRASPFSVVIRCGDSVASFSQPGPTRKSTGIPLTGFP